MALGKRQKTKLNLFFQISNICINIPFRLLISTTIRGFAHIMSIFVLTKKPKF